MRKTTQRAYHAALGVLPLEARRRYLFARAHGHMPDLGNPATFSEKLTWRILHDRREILEWTCDKELMKATVRQLDPTVKAVPTIWFGTDIRESDPSSFPDRWVMKPNRQSGGRVHFGEGRPDIEVLNSIAAQWSAGEERHIRWLGEWAYSVARPGMIVEPRLRGPKPGQPPVDYKVFVFHGRAHLVQVHEGRGGEHDMHHMTPEWEWASLRTSRLHEVANKPERPESLEAMLEQACRIAADFDFLRVDFYEVDGAPVFGEVTPYPAGGLRKYYPAGADAELGALWQLADVA